MQRKNHSPSFFATSFSDKILYGKVLQWWIPAFLPAIHSVYRGNVRVPKTLAVQYKEANHRLA